MPLRLAVAAGKAALRPGRWLRGRPVLPLQQRPATSPAALCARFRRPGHTRAKSMPPLRHGGFRRVLAVWLV